MPLVRSQESRIGTNRKRPPTLRRGRLSEKAVLDWKIARRSERTRNEAARIRSGPKRVTDRSFPGRQAARGHSRDAMICGPGTTEQEAPSQIDISQPTVGFISPDLFQKHHKKSAVLEAYATISYADLGSLREDRRDG